MGFSAQEYQEEAAAIRKRYEQEKREYNDTLNLEDDILPDQKAIDECECGSGDNDIKVKNARLRCEQNWTRFRRDHANFNQGHHAPEQGVDSCSFNRFKELPGEIKNQIYRHVLCGSHTRREIRQWQLYYESRKIPFELRFTDLQPLDTRILVASREVYNSALQELYSVNTFVVDISKANATPLFVRDATSSLSPRPTSKIRRWHIRLSYRRTEDEELIMPQIIAVRDAMKQCASLEEIRFTWICSSDGWTAPLDLIHSYDSMLKQFLDVRGVRKVSFTEEFFEEDLGRINKWLDGWGDLQMASQDVREIVKASMERPRA